MIKLRVEEQCYDGQDYQIRVGKGPMILLGCSMSFLDCVIQELSHSYQSVRGAGYSSRDYDEHFQRQQVDHDHDNSDDLEHLRKEEEDSQGYIIVKIGFINK